MENIQKYKWHIIASFCSALTIIVIKYYEIYSYAWFLLVAVLSEYGVIYSYIQLLKKGDIVTEFAIVKIIAIFIVIIPSILLFESNLTIEKTIGLILGIISIYLLN